MRWKGRRASSNVEDRRGQSPGRGGGTVFRGPVLGGGGGRPMGCGCVGMGLIIVAVILLGGPQQLLEMAQQQEQQPQQPRPRIERRQPDFDPRTESQFPEQRRAPVGADELGQMSAVVLADTEETWRKEFAAEGYRYREPTMVLFSGSVSSACGFHSAATGPFYCPADEKLYLDLVFFSELERRFGAQGDFAQAYVIAHEVGHHVQNLLGISDQVQRERQRSSQADANELSVRMELQADCLAGVWAHQAHRDRQLLEPGDIEEGLRAAAAIGDDNIQRRTTGYVQPESWTHGSSEQRTQWLRRGLETGDSDACDTFN